MGYCFGCFAELEKAGVCPRCGYDPREDEGRYPMALPQGSILKERYIVGRVLGQGGFGITYAALDFETKELMAIKEYMPGALASRDSSGTVTSHGGQTTADFINGKQGFLDEANTLVDFSRNPHIVNISDYFEQNGTAYFVMEYVRGRNLKAYVKLMGGRLGQEEANRILLPIMEALGEVHAKGLVHRDIAPDNIIVTAEGSAKLIDFGAARYSTGEKSLSLDVILKHGYAPVEQYSRHGRQGAYTDVYAMAATYYYAVTGAVPPDSIDRARGERLIPPSELGAKLDAQTERVLFKALAVEQQDRYRNMGDFVHALRGETVTPAFETKSPEKNTESAKKTKKPLIIALAAVLLIALVIGCFSLTGESKEPWSFDEKSGVLTIQGEGAMQDFILGYSKYEIPWEQFKGSITKVVIKKGVTEIAEKAFAECTELKELELPEGLVRICKDAFYNCSALERVELPDTVEVLDEYAFCGCMALEEAVLSESLGLLDGYAFMRCFSLKSIDFPDGLETIGNHAFHDCDALEEVWLPGALKYINDSCFYSCDSLKKVVIPEGVTHIEEDVFNSCGKLEEIWLPTTLTDVGEEAFYGCGSLSTVYYAGQAIQVREK